MTYEEKKQRFANIDGSDDAETAWAYTELQKAWKALEGISSDRDEGGAEGYYGEIAWRTLNS